MVFCFKKSPLYDWKAMERDGYSWWVRRLRRAQNLFDEFRIDHFRGFAGFWAVPSGEITFICKRLHDTVVMGSIIYNQFMCRS